MIKRDFNHPSIILWGVRINESQDNHDFYSATNSVAHKLDDTRQTGGVRVLEGSEFLEDVYTMNDFIYSGKNTILRKQQNSTNIKRKVPYLVTEYNGHMYPTKRFDQEQRLIEHSRRHMEVLNKQLGAEDMAGAIGWCAFDYNTHKDFGSGDKVCYHGVMDMFRIPKYAAGAYSSQISNNQKVIMEIASLVAKGEKDGGGYFPIMAYTNCDYIEVFQGSTKLDTFYPTKEKYNNIIHPPIIIKRLLGENVEHVLSKAPFSKRDEAKFGNFISAIMDEGSALSTHSKLTAIQLMIKYKISGSDLTKMVMDALESWGTKDTSLTFAGYIDNREVVRKTYGGQVYACRLSADADDKILSTQLSSYDATRVVYKVVDQNNNLLPFINESVMLEIEGPGEIIGPNRVALIGGCIAVWVKTTGEKGVIKLKAKCSRFNSDDVEINVE